MCNNPILLLVHQVPHCPGKRKAAESLRPFNNDYACKSIMPEWEIITVLFIINDIRATFIVISRAADRSIPSRQ